MSFEDTTMALTLGVRLCTGAVSSVATAVRERVVVRFLGRTRRMTMSARSIACEIQGGVGRDEVLVTRSFGSILNRTIMILVENQSLEARCHTAYISAQ